MPVRGKRQRNEKQAEILAAPMAEDTGGWAVDHPDGKAARVELRNGAWEATYNTIHLGIFDNLKNAEQTAREAKVVDVLGPLQPDELEPVVMPSPEKQLKLRFGGLSPERIKEIGGFDDNQLSQVLAVINS